MLIKVKNILDEVAFNANTRKIKIGMLSGFTEHEMRLYISDITYRKKRNDII